MFVADENGMTWFKDGSNGGLTAADDSVWFMLDNNTQRFSYWGLLPTAGTSLGGLASTGYTGSTAEFILERPYVNGSPVPLALFFFTIMNTCWYGDSEYGYDQWPLGASGSTPFAGNLAYLNMQNPATGNLLAIPISLPDPNSGAQGYQILWWWLNYA